MPRGYWLEPVQLTSAIIVAEPSTEEFDRIQSFTATHPDSGYDMDIMDSIYNTSALVFPHRNYLLLTREFREDTHEKYLGNEYEAWDATKALAETRYVHWSEWPYSKPWIEPSKDEFMSMQPKCHDVENQGKECRDRDAYMWLKEDFTRRRRVSGP